MDSKEKILLDVMLIEIGFDDYEFFEKTSKHNENGYIFVTVTLVDQIDHIYTIDDIVNISSEIRKIENGIRDKGLKFSLLLVENNKVTYKIEKKENCIMYHFNDATTVVMPGKTYEISYGYHEPAYIFANSECDAIDILIDTISGRNWDGCFIRDDELHDYTEDQYIVGGNNSLRLYTPYGISITEI